MDCAKSLKRYSLIAACGVSLLLLSGCFETNLSFGGKGNPFADNGGGEPPVAEPTNKVAKGINDTGITLCGTTNSASNGLNCTTVGATQTTAGTDSNNAVPAGQDAVYGRDALEAEGQLIKVGYGPAGFDYTKLDANGDDLPKEATTWSCLRDNVTGLIWEVKTTNEGLHNVNNTYSWYNSNSSTNGGDPGSQGNSNSCTDSDCNTEAFAAAVNTEKLCGFDDWRMPSTKELQSIVNKGRASPAVNAELGVVDITTNYCSALPHAEYSGSAWSVNFSYGSDSAIIKNSNCSVRLVRSGQ